MAQEAAQSTVILDHVFFLEEDEDLTDLATAITKIGQNKHEL